jgi:hypothetical protein
MNPLWWQLPGPAAFLNLVDGDLRQGKSVVLALPEYAPTGLREALAGQVKKNDFWDWRQVSLQENESSSDDPVRLLSDRLALSIETAPNSLFKNLPKTFQPANRNLQSNPVPDVKALVDCEAFCGNVIWLEGLTERFWQNWQAFFDEYAQFCQNRCELERSLFCVPMVGTLTQQLPTETETLSIRRWHGVVDRLDMQLYISSQKAHSRVANTLERNLIIAMGAEIAGTDPELANRLSKLPFNELLAPFETLKQVAKQRGWNEEQLSDPKWHLGMLDDIEGTPIVHAAVLAMQANRDQKSQDELRRRIWRGQVGVLFPFIEEQRVRLLEELHAFLEVPLETPFGTITEIHDLEIGHIDYLVKKNSPKSHKAEPLLKSLKEIRHTIAHLDPISATQLEELRRLLKT